MCIRDRRKVQPPDPQRPTHTSGGNGAGASRRVAIGITSSRLRAEEQSLPLLSYNALHRQGSRLTDARRVGQVIQRDHDVTKEELLEFEGLVLEILPDARYRIQLDNGHVLVAYTAGKMKKNRIKTLAGDRVTVEVSPYDLEKGRLIFRHKDERAASVSRPPQRNQFRRR